jgi:hypothetical protein
MTQTVIIPSTDILATTGARHAVDALLAALDVAETIPTTGGHASAISGQPVATYGPLIRIEHEMRVNDDRGPWLLGGTRWTEFAEPADAGTTLLRMLAEGREIFSVTAVRGALHRRHVA